MMILSLTYIKSLDEVETYLQEHIEYLKTYYASGDFLASGRKIPRTGGVILAQGTRQHIENIITHDPFYRHKIATYELTEFIPTMTSQDLAFLQETLSSS